MAEVQVRVSPPAAEGSGINVAGRLVDAIRETVAILVERGEPPSLEQAVNLIEAHLGAFEARSPLADDLRPWQLLASDLSVALAGLDAALSVRARVVADRFRAIISMMHRNPADSLGLRSSSRRVLVALCELGGRAAIEEVRARSGHSVTHLSNILKALRGHGVVAEEPAPEDGRRKILFLTEAGRAIIDAAGTSSTAPASPPARFVSAIHVNRQPTGRVQKYEPDLEIVRLPHEEGVADVA